MHVFDTLPEDYRELFTIHLQKDKKLALIINIGALVLGVLMAVPAHLFYQPISTLFDVSGGWGLYWGRLGVLILGEIAYIILHELVHGITMKRFGAKRVKYGFTGLYAFAGSDEFFDKKSYLTVALAPVVVWGIVLLLLQFLVPAPWFWVVWAIQIGNISGAAGDAYVTWKFSSLPADILVSDCGVGMTVYTRQTIE